VIGYVGCVHPGSMAVRHHSDPHSPQRGGDVSVRATSGAARAAAANMNWSQLPAHSPGRRTSPAISRGHNPIKKNVDGRSRSDQVYGTARWNIHADDGVRRDGRPRSAEARSFWMTTRPRENDLRGAWREGDGRDDARSGGASWEQRFKDAKLFEGVDAQDRTPAPGGAGRGSVRSPRSSKASDRS